MRKCIINFKTIQRVEVILNVSLILIYFASLGRAQSLGFIDNEKIVLKLRDSQSYIAFDKGI
jgi:hypothetical protein